MRTTRPLVALAAGALLFGITPYAEAEAPARIKTAEPVVRWITLVTGDRVMVRDEPGKPQRIVFTPTPGTGSTGAFTVQVGGGHTLVIPSIAMHDVAAGRLDRSLFDVTALLQDRYDDQHTKTLPVIVTYTGGRARAAQDRPAGAARSRVLNSIGARSVAITKSSTRAFWASMTAAGRVEAGVRTIQLDRRVKASIDQSVPQIGAPAGWQRGHTGRGVKVAVLDTGVDDNHPDLTGKVAAEANFSESPDTEDRVGHGTHVAGILAGTGAASNGKHSGVAPDATLLNGKVLGDEGWGTFSGIIAGMEWAAAQGAKVVNMSLGGGPSDGTDLLSQALNRISTETGALFVVAAGNCDSSEPQQTSAPASADTALAVANLQRDGTVNGSSCRGLRKGDFALKPEIAAPGTEIVSAQAGGQDYVAYTGTSMAAPHVAGTAALLAQAQPELTGAQLRNRLISTADHQHDQTVAEHGAGRVDADQATDGSVSVDQGELEYGYIKWPHTSQQPITKTLTYRNAGSTPITLDVTTQGDHESAVPALSAKQLVVPAGGQGTVDVTADMAAAALGSHTGRIVASPTSGGDPLVTPFAWHKEHERHDVTVRGINRDGSPANEFVLIGRPDGKPLDGLDPEGTRMVDGKVTVRVPPGVLDVSMFFGQDATDSTPATLTLVNQPQVNVTGPTTVTLDARTAKPANLSAGGVPGLTSRYRAMRHYRTQVDGGPAALYSAHELAPGIRYFATPTKPVTVGSMEYRTGGRLELPPYSARSLGDGGRTIPVSDLFRATRFTGVRDLVAIDGGTGKPAELTGVRGKLALIRHDPRASGYPDNYPDTVLTAAQDAGAAAVLLFNPNRPGVDGAVDQVDVLGAHTIPVMRTSRAAATDLLALAKTRTVTVRIVGIQYTPFVYDLMAPTIGRVPADPGHVAWPKDLATVTETFGAHVQGTLISEDRTPSTILEPPIIISPISVHPWLPAPFTRVAFVSADPIVWDQHVLARGWSVTPIRAHPAGSRSRIAWFAPVANSGLPNVADTGRGVQRVDDWIFACFNAINIADYVELISPSDATMTIERNGELVGTIDSGCAFAETPAGPADYQIELDARREDENWKYSTRVRSTWRFHAQGGADEKMPVILADLGVPSASLLNQVKVGKPTTITLATRHQHGSTASPFTSTKLEMSYDGQTWTELPLTPAGTNRHTATVTHPADQAGGAVHLRLDVADSAGGRLSQEVTRAYGLTQ